MFQATRPHGARPRGLVTDARPLGFKPRARTGRDARTPPFPLPQTGFKPRARTGRDAEQARPEINVKKFQATRPHGARHNRPALTVGPTAVSSHAPARGATEYRTDRNDQRPVSSHAPARGATWWRPQGSSASRMFQATRPHGARPDRDRLIFGVLLFQATRPHGARPRCAEIPRTFYKFQATRPHGARRPDLVDLFRQIAVSSHAPARGATWSRPRPAPRRVVSSHAPARGATVRDIQSSGRIGCFKPRARTGRDSTPQKVSNGNAFRGALREPPPFLRRREIENGLKSTWMEQCRHRETA